MDGAGDRLWCHGEGGDVLFVPSSRGSAPSLDEDLRRMEGDCSAAGVGERRRCSGLKNKLFIWRLNRLVL